MPLSSPSPRQVSLECLARVKQKVLAVRFRCTVHNRQRVSLVVHPEDPIRLSMHPGLENDPLEIACRVEMERRGESGWWNVPEGTAVYERSVYTARFTETRNCYLAMWLPQLLMRQFVRNEAAVLGEGQAKVE